jgi:hypothetical protein
MMEGIYFPETLDFFPEYTALNRRNTFSGKESRKKNRASRKLTLSKGLSGTKAARFVSLNAMYCSSSSFPYYCSYSSALRIRTSDLFQYRINA